MNTRTILTSTAALAALTLAACSSPDSGSEVETAPVADSSPAATETTDDGPDSSTQSDGGYEGSEHTNWTYDDERGWYEEEVKPAPHAEAPPVEPCPHHEEVSGVNGDRAEQFDRAVSLGCEVGIHGEIDFAQPLDPAEDGSGVYSIIDPEHALSVAEMCDQGYMPEESC